MSDHHDEFSRLEGKRNIFENIQVFADPFVQPQGFYFQPARFIVLGKLFITGHEAVRPDANRVPGGEPDTPLDALVVDEGAVHTLQVGNPKTAANPLDLGVEMRDGGHVHDDVVAGVAAKGQGVLLIEGDHAEIHGGRGFAGRVVGHSDHRAGQVTLDAQNVVVVETVGAYGPAFKQEDIGGLRRNHQFVAAVYLF